jgi:hypothetical protein
MTPNSDLQITAAPEGDKQYRGNHWYTQLV